MQLADLENDPELAEGHDFALERSLITEHLKDLEMNRYPQISKKLGRPIEDINAAVRRLRGLSPYPGKLIGGQDRRRSRRMQSSITTRKQTRTRSR